MHRLWREWLLMKTERFLKKDLPKAAKLIRNGEIVAFPTDTVYGLGADAGNEDAVKKIFIAKGRPADRALTVLIADKNDMSKYASDVPKEALRLVENFWPGPLTIVLNKKGVFAPSVTANLDTIGLRMPKHPLTLEFIKECGVPLAAPSANSSGRLSPTTADHVLSDLDGKISAIIDGGETPFGIESTILDLSNPERPLLLRPGGITKNQLEAVIGKKIFIENTSSSKNIKNDKHYEPIIPLYMVESDWKQAIQEMLEQKEQIGILANDEIISEYGNQAVESYSLGKKGDIDSANKNLFKGLRSLEKSAVTVILAEAYNQDELSEAYTNRLKNAANGKTI